ncbi:acyl-CoA N-acyltransferase [Saccharata proteae CBS 121410]|uniref:Acyl-CoA N-acyltransferase n=1 Tax=Saccharata proteae CBS 121410 TaxID=1314787 RepID=A0A9P4HV92_9PEZI|nr:acyl-CoA N-acyltransferase [Saccharata proteae CBS 121410]
MVFNHLTNLDAATRTAPTTTTTTANTANSTVSAALPPPILSTPSFQIRPYSPHDAAATAAAAASPSIGRYMSNAFPTPYTLSSASSWIALVLAEPAKPDWLITLPAPHDGTVIGAIGLKPGRDTGARSAELGYWLAERWWGRGVMSAAVRAFARWVFGGEGWRADGGEGIERLEARVVVGNVGSGRVLEKCGFRRVGVLRRAWWKGGRWFDLELWELVRGDWEAGGAVTGL